MDITGEACVPLIHVLRRSSFRVGDGCRSIHELILVLVGKWFGGDLLQHSSTQLESRRQRTVIEDVCCKRTSGLEHVHHRGGPSRARHYSFCNNLACSQQYPSRAPRSNSTSGDCIRTVEGKRGHLKASRSQVKNCRSPLQILPVPSSIRIVEALSSADMMSNYGYWY